MQTEQIRYENVPSPREISGGWAWRGGVIHYPLNPHDGYPGKSNRNVNHPHEYLPSHFIFYQTDQVLFFSPEPVH
jgi:hypothetical protein